jgi:hypothetical protein
MATLHHDDAAFTGALLVVAKPQLLSFSCQELADTAWALAWLGHRDPAFMVALLQAAKTKLRDFDAQDLSSTAWALA